MNNVALAIYTAQTKVEKLLKDRKGATLVEYALLLVAIMILVATLYKTLGKSVGQSAQKATSALG